MRIIADNKDYYDCIQAHGQDRSLVYVRKPEEVSFERSRWTKAYVREWPFPEADSWFWNDDNKVLTRIIGFCGKIYPMLEVSVKGIDKTAKCFSIEDVDVFVESQLKSSYRKNYYNSRWYGSCLRRKPLKEFFDDCKKKQDAYSKYFSEKLCPIFVATHDKGTIIYNALLRPHDFVRVFDPYTAFQEISMFLGSMAMPENEMPVIPDELKIRSKGFTDQSFRASFKDSKRIPK